MPSIQTIAPCLWLDDQAEEAAGFYTSVFNHSRIIGISRYPEVGQEAHGKPPGSVMTVEFELNGEPFTALNGGPVFRFTPSISFFVPCESKKEVDGLWEKLSAGGTALMPLQKYPWSERYGWVQDKYGLSWQIMLVEDGQATRQIAPALMFTGEQAGRAEEAMRFYTSVFDHAKIDEVFRYGEGEEPDQAGTIKYAAFTLGDQPFKAMDSNHEHGFTFNEAVSLQVNCRTQDEVDYYWEKLSDGGEEVQCGWLKDRFGLSWQITPVRLIEMIMDADAEKMQRAFAAMLKMKKIDIAELERAYAG
ncbi:MAG: VOC family protein [Phycisphaeraceae bacterium]